MAVRGTTTGASLGTWPDEEAEFVQIQTGRTERRRMWSARRNRYVMRTVQVTDLGRAAPVGAAVLGKAKVGTLLRRKPTLKNYGPTYLAMVMNYLYDFPGASIPEIAVGANMLVEPVWRVLNVNHRVEFMKYELQSWPRLYGWENRQGDSNVQHTG